MNNHFFCKLVFIVLSAWLLSACSSHSGGAHKIDPVPVLNAQQVDLSNSKLVKQKLSSHYKKWKGVPYAYGGLSKRGVDCSGFVYTAYLELGLKVPRSTKQQSITGDVIEKDQLKPGDMVFFKTGYKMRHVGVYIGENKFIHASSKKGVMISSLNDYYWKDKYWYSRRLDI